jgi:hypothetical protein
VCVCVCERERERETRCKTGEKKLLPMPAAHVQGKKMIYNTIKTTLFCSFFYRQNMPFHLTKMTIVITHFWVPAQKRKKWKRKEKE